MPDPINPESPVADAPDVSAPAGKSNEESVGLAELLGKELGRVFKDDSEALKSVKETYSYVGEYGKVAGLIKAGKEKFGGEESFLNKMNDIIKEPTAADPAPKPGDPQPNAVDPAQIAALEERAFYAENPEYKPYKDLIRSFGKDPEKVVESEVFKSTFTKLKAHDETQSSKSVLQSSPRLSEASDKATAARDALAAGKESEAKNLGLDAVMDAVFPDK